MTPITISVAYTLPYKKSMKKIQKNLHEYAIQRIHNIPKELEILNKIPNQEDRIQALEVEMQDLLHPTCPYCRIELEEIIIRTWFGENLFSKQCPICHYTKGIGIISEE